MLSVRRLLAISVLAAALPLAGCNSLGGGFQANVGGEAASAPKGNTPAIGDELARAKTHFRERNFGLAESQFRTIVEREPGNAEAWLGLAASYDQLRRYELADRAYEQVRKLAGSSVALHNNAGMSFLMRGNRQRARAEFRKAQQLDPNNEFVRNNLAALR